MYASRRVVTLQSMALVFLVGGCLDPWLIFVQGVVEGEVVVCGLDGIVICLAGTLLRVVVAEEGAFRAQAQRSACTGWDDPARSNLRRDNL